MSPTILQQVWDKAILSLSDETLFEKDRLGELLTVVNDDSHIDLETILKKEYETQKVNN